MEEQDSLLDAPSTTPNPTTVSRRARWLLAVAGAALVLVGVAAVLLTVGPLASGGDGPPGYVVRAPRAGDVVINEFTTQTPQATSWIELMNVAVDGADLSGYQLQWRGEHAHQYTIPSGSVVAPGGFLVLPLPLDFWQPGRQLQLRDPSGEEAVLDSVSLPEQHLPLGASIYREPDGGMFSENPDPDPTPGVSNHIYSSQTWIPGEFQIHVMDVGQGDSQLIVFPSGYSVLIDVSESNWNSQATSVAVATKVQHILGHKDIDVAVISHLHLDHMGYVGYGGFYGMIVNNRLNIKRLIDRDAGQWVDLNGDGMCTEKEIQWKYAGTFSGTSWKWLCWATDPRNSIIYPRREVAQLCSETQISSPADVDVTVTIVTTDGLGAKLKDGVSPVSADYHDSSLPPSENDFSIGLKIRYGDFVYATFGDLDGHYASSSQGYTYNDIEAVTGPRTGPVDVYHVNHHGSSHSSSSGFLNILQPSVALISCGTGNSYGHPAQNVLDSLNSRGVSTYTTSQCYENRNYAPSVHRLSTDIVVRCEDGTHYSVSGGNGLHHSYQAAPKDDTPCKL